MRPCHVPDARGKTVGPALSVSFARVPAPIRLLGRYPPAYDRNLARVSRRAARPTIAAGQAAAAGPASPLVSTLLAGLIAGLLGLPAGAAALALARRHCRRPLPARPLPEVATALLWALLALRVWPSHPAALPAYLALGLACVALVVIDLDSNLLPDRITYPTLGLVAVLLLVASVFEHDLGRMLRALEAGGVAGGVALASPGGMGLGDVKFALVLGLALGWLGWSAVVAGFVGAFLLGGLAALGAMLILRVGRKTQLPFGPWLALGALLAILGAAPVPPT